MLIVEGFISNHAENQAESTVRGDPCYSPHLFLLCVPADAFPLPPLFPIHPQRCKSFSSFFSCVLVKHYLKIFVLLYSWFVFL